jgi:hypothetical protein
MLGHTPTDWGPTLGNKSIQFYCPISTESNISFSQRICHVSNFTTRLKASPIKSVGSFILNIIEFFFSCQRLQTPLTKLLMGDKYWIGKTFGLSNVPGPNGERSLGGNMVTSISASVNLPQMFTALSYNGVIRVVATLDRAHIDADLLVYSVSMPN